MLLFGLVPLRMTVDTDVAVIGSGPTGSVLAWRLAHREKLRVCLIDPNMDRPWENNYGVWSEEWETLGADLKELDLGSCVSRTWPVTDCFFGGSWGKPENERTRLDRAYARVDRLSFQKRLRADETVVQIKEGLDARASAHCSNVYDTDRIAHDATGTTLRLAGGTQVRAKLVVDATGFESQLTTRNEMPAPGYQIAFGFEAIVDSLGDYDDDAMLLFDYRTVDKTEFPPTFMYAMPLGKEQGGTRVFFEETVLVSKPALSLAECERRADKRLAKLNITLLSAKEDVELCYIPMGGPIPDPRQRIVAFGASAGLVHPATGYQLCRSLMASKEAAKAIGQSLREYPTNPDAAAAAAYAAVWGKSTSLQRDFMLFGAEFLLTLDENDLRGWFDAFFKLDTPVWAGFLAGWPGLPGNSNHETRFNRLRFGVDMFFKLPPAVALKLVAFIFAFSLEDSRLLRSVVPFFFGDGDFFTPLKRPDVQVRRLGDLNVKNEYKTLRAELSGNEASSLAAPLPDKERLVPVAPPQAT